MCMQSARGSERVEALNFYGGVEWEGRPHQIDYCGGPPFTHCPYYGTKYHVHAALSIVGAGAGAGLMIVGVAALEL